MLHSVNDEIVFLVKSDISNNKVHLIYNVVMVCTVESSTFLPKRSH